MGSLPVCALWCKSVLFKLHIRQRGLTHLSITTFFVIFSIWILLYLQTVILWTHTDQFRRAPPLLLAGPFSSPLSLWFSQFQYYYTTFIQPYCGLLLTRAPPLLLAGPFSSTFSLCFSKFEYYYTFIQPYCGLKQISFVEPHQCYKPGNFLTSQLPARWRWRIQQSIITSLWPH